MARAECGSNLWLVVKTAAEAARQQIQVYSLG